MYLLGINPLLNFSLYRIPLYRVKSVRRLFHEKGTPIKTLLQQQSTKLKYVGNKITGPEPLSNYMDVSFIEININKISSDIHR